MEVKQILGQYFREYHRYAKPWQLLKVDIKVNWKIFRKYQFNFVSNLKDKSEFQDNGYTILTNNKIYISSSKTQKWTKINIAYLLYIYKKDFGVSLDNKHYYPVATQPELNVLHDV